jgi:hypothetical protein
LRRLMRRTSYDWIHQEAAVIDSRRGVHNGSVNLQTDLPAVTRGRLKVGVNSFGGAAPASAPAVHVDSVAQSGPPAPRFLAKIPQFDAPEAQESSTVSATHSSGRRTLPFQ